jgi:OOP family OmpA-OmpF porin
VKKQFFVALIGTALVLPFAAQAQAQTQAAAEARGAYIGANLGRSELKVTVTNVGSEKKTDTGFKLYGGYQFNNNFGLETGYADLGKISGSNGAASVSGETTAFFIAATGTLPLNAQFALFAKAGLSLNSTKVRATLNGITGSSTENETTPIFGAGASYSFTKNLAVVAEYEDFGKVAKDRGIDLKANLFSVGLRYKF